jgi:adenylate cyclase
VYLELGRYELAMAKAEDVLSLNPNSASANYLLGYSLSRSGRPKDAITHLDRAIQLSPRDIAIGGFYGVKAVALFHLGLYQESADWGQRSINSPNPRPIAFLYLFGALIKLGRAEEAEAMLPELMRLKPDLALSEMREKIEHDYSRSGNAVEILFTCLRDLDLPE